MEQQTVEQLRLVKFHCLHTAFAQEVLVVKNAMVFGTVFMVPCFTVSAC